MTAGKRWEEVESLWQNLWARLFGTLPPFVSTAAVVSLFRYHVFTSNAPSASFGALLAAIQAHRA